VESRSKAIARKKTNQKKSMIKKMEESVPLYDYVEE